MPRTRRKVEAEAKLEESKQQEIEYPSQEDVIVSDPLFDLTTIPQDLAALLVKDLRQLCLSLQIADTGKKSLLIKRIALERTMRLERDILDGIKTINTLKSPKKIEFALTNISVSPSPIKPDASASSGVIAHAQAMLSFESIETRLQKLVPKDTKPVIISRQSGKIHDQSFETLKRLERDTLDGINTLKSPKKIEFALTNISVSPSSIKPDAIASSGAIAHAQAMLSFESIETRLQKLVPKDTKPVIISRQSGKIHDQSFEILKETVKINPVVSIKKSSQVVWSQIKEKKLVTNEAETLKTNPKIIHSATSAPKIEDNFRCILCSRIRIQKGGYVVLHYLKPVIFAHSSTTASETNSIPLCLPIPSDIPEDNMSDVLVCQECSIRNQMASKSYVNQFQKSINDVSQSKSFSESKPLGSTKAGNFKAQPVNDDFIDYSSTVKSRIALPQTNVFQNSISSTQHSEQSIRIKNEEIVESARSPKRPYPNHNPSEITKKIRNSPVHLPTSAKINANGTNSPIRNGSMNRILDYQSTVKKGGAGFILSKVEDRSPTKNSIKLYPALNFK